MEKLKKLDSIKQELEVPEKQQGEEWKDFIFSSLSLRKGEFGECWKKGKGERQRVKIQEKSTNQYES